MNATNLGRSSLNPTVRLNVEHLTLVAHLGKPVVIDDTEYGANTVGELPPRLGALMFQSIFTLRSSELSGSRVHLLRRSRDVQTAQR